MTQKISQGKCDECGKQVKITEHAVSRTCNHEGKIVVDVSATVYGVGSVEPTK